MTVGGGLRAELGTKVFDDLATAGFVGQFVTADVATSHGAAKAVNAALDAYGMLNIVVNCAGIISFGMVEERDAEEWERVLRVNLKSMFLVSRCAIPALRAAAGGSIIKYRLLARRRHHGPPRGLRNK